MRPDGAGMKAHTEWHRIPIVRCLDQGSMINGNHRRHDDHELDGKLGSETGMMWLLLFQIDDYRVLGIIVHRIDWKHLETVAQLIQDTAPSLQSIQRREKRYTVCA